jgi:hypothetical protein
LDISSWNAFSSIKIKSDGQRRPANNLGLIELKKWVNDLNPWLVTSGKEVLAFIPTENEWEHAFLVSELSVDKAIDFSKPVGDELFAMYFKAIEKYAVINNEDSEFIAANIPISKSRQPIGFLYDTIGSLEEMTLFDQRGDETWNLLEEKGGQ